MLTRAREDAREEAGEDGGHLLSHALGGWKVETTENKVEMLPDDIALLMQALSALSAFSALLLVLASILMNRVLPSVFGPRPRPRPRRPLCLCSPPSSQDRCLPSGRLGELLRLLLLLLLLSILRWLQRRLLLVLVIMVFLLPLLLPLLGHGGRRRRPGGGKGTIPVFGVWLEEGKEETVERLEKSQNG